MNARGGAYTLDTLVMRPTALCPLLLSLVAGCFPTRSSELACTTSAECEDGSSCYIGYCLPIDAGMASMIDAPPDEPEPDAAPECSAEWGTPPTVGDPCRFAKGPAVTITGTQTLDTTSGLLGGDDGELVSVGGIQARMYIVDSFTVSAGATLRATGPHPVLVISWGDISIAGTIDVSSKTAGTPIVGAGGNATTCPAIPDGGTNNNGGGAGGGGGGLGTAGGNGGQGGSNGGRQIGATGGPSASPLLQGGCRGGRGGNTPNAEGGGGGGAIYLVSKTRITVSGTIDAGGAGGLGATGRGGGGGGGAGGMIGLEAPVVSTTGTLAANGGGGGQGVDGDPGGVGQDGKATATVATGGGPGGDQCGPGGAGGFAATAATGGVNGNCSSNGGGGGGGAYGIIVVKSPSKTLGGVVTPTAR